MTKIMVDLLKYPVELGRGTYGRVYQVYDNELKKLVAVKSINLILNSEDIDDENKNEVDFLLNSETRLIGILNEINALKKLKHPNIVEMYKWEFDTGLKERKSDQLIKGKVTQITREYEKVTDGKRSARIKRAKTCCTACKEKEEEPHMSLAVLRESKILITLELMNMSLHSFIASISKFDNLNQQFDRKRIFTQICKGLAHAHSMGYFHRDIHPGNILLTYDPDSASYVAKISDFGFAEKIKEGRRYELRTCPINYRSPETLLGLSNYNEKVDIWALGCVMYELYTFTCLIEPVHDTSVDALTEILSLLHPRSYESWDKMKTFIRHHPILYKSCVKRRATECVVQFEDDPIATDLLLNHLLMCDPNERSSLQECIETHDYFKV